MSLTCQILPSFLQGGQLDDTASLCSSDSSGSLFFKYIFYQNLCTITVRIILLSCKFLDFKTFKLYFYLDVFVVIGKSLMLLNGFLPIGRICFLLRQFCRKSANSWLDTTRIRSTAFLPKKAKKFVSDPKLEWISNLVPGSTVTHYQFI